MALDNKFSKVEAPSRGPATDDLYAPITDEELKALESDPLYAPITAEELAAVDDSPSAMDRVAAAASGIAESATFGYQPEIRAAVEPGLEWAFGRLTGDPLLPEQSESYDERLLRSRAEQEALQAKAPGSALAGQVAGFFVPGAGITKALGAGGKALKASRIAGVSKATKGAGMATKGAKLAGSRIGPKYGAEKALETAGGMGPLAAKGAVLAGTGAIEGYLYNPEETGMTRAEGALSTAAFGGALSVASPIAKSAIKSGFNVISGVNIANINRYISRAKYAPDTLKDVPEMDAIKQSIDEVIIPIREELANAKIGLKEADNDLKYVEDLLKQQFKDKKKEISMLVQTRKQELDAAYQNSYDQLKKVSPPPALVDDVLGGIDGLKTEVREQSSRAFQILKDELGDQQLDLALPIQRLEDAMEGLKIRGEVPSMVKQHYDVIESLTEEVKDYQALGGLTGPEIKQYIMRTLDPVVDEAYKLGTWKTPSLGAISNLRNDFSFLLKSKSKGYREFMEVLADDTGLVSEMMKKAATPEKVERLLSRIDNPKLSTERNLLKRFFARTNPNSGEDLLMYLEQKNKFKQLQTFEGKVALKAGQDEFIPYQNAKRMLDEYQSLNQMQLKEMAEKQAKESQQAMAKELAEARLKNAEYAVEQVKTWTTQNSEQKIKKLINIFNSGKKGQGITARQELEKLVNLSGQDFEEMIDKLSLQEAFSATFLRGSRNVNLWAALGSSTGMIGRSGAGAMSGGLMMGGSEGMMIGAALGATMDIFGPAITKQMLRGMVAIQGLPTRSKIMKMDVPPEAKRYLLTQFEATVLTAWSGNPLQLDSEDIPFVLEDIRRNDEFTPSEKAKMISDINKSGVIRDPAKYFGEVEVEEKSNVQNYVESIN